MTLMKTLVISLCPLLIPMTAAADEYPSNKLSFDQPWARATAPGAPVGAGFMSIHNNSDEPDRLTGGSVDFAGEVQIHKSGMHDGMMRMQHLEAGLELPPGETIVLRPGSYHLMFLELQRRLVEGDSEVITLEFERAGNIELELTVLGPGERGPHQEAGDMNQGEMPKH